MLTQSKLVLKQPRVPRTLLNKVMKLKKKNRSTWNEVFTQGLILVLKNPEVLTVTPVVSKSEQKRLGMIKKIYKERNTAWPYAVYQGTVKLASYRTLEMLKEKHPDAVSKKDLK